MNIYCCKCDGDVNADLVSGSDIYKHRKDLSSLSFYRCGECNNYVGCHKGTQTPLGVIPTDEIRKARTKIHEILDPIWREHGRSRNEVYKEMSRYSGINPYHTAEIRSMDQARKAYRAAYMISIEAYEMIDI